MPRPKENWVKPRSHGTGLTADEIALIRQRHREGIAAKDTARELLCSTRIVNKYYGQFAGKVYERNRTNKKSMTGARSVAHVVPNVAHSDFLKPLSKAQLMAGR